MNKKIEIGTEKDEEVKKRIIGELTELTKKIPELSYGTLEFDNGETCYAMSFKLECGEDALLCLFVTSALERMLGARSPLPWNVAGAKKG